MIAQPLVDGFRVALMTARSLVECSRGDLIHDLFSAVDESNWEALPCFFHPHIIYNRPGYSPLVGLERMIQFYRDERVIREGRHMLDTVVGTSDCAACWGRFLGLTKRGEVVDELFADFYSFEDDKIIVRRSFFYRPAI